MTCFLLRKQRSSWKYYVLFDHLDYKYWTKNHLLLHSLCPPHNRYMANICTASALLTTNIYVQQHTHFHIHCSITRNFNLILLKMTSCMNFDRWTLKLTSSGASATKFVHKLALFSSCLSSGLEFNIYSALQHSWKGTTLGFLWVLHFLVFF